MSSDTDTPSSVKIGNNSIQEVFTDLLDCRNQDDLMRVIKDKIYPAFDDDFRHFVINFPEGEHLPLLGCSGLPRADQNIIREYLNSDPLAQLLLLQNEVSEQIYLRNENQAHILFPFLAFKIKSVMLEQELEKTRAMVQGLLKSPAGIAVVDSSKKVVEFNAAFKDIIEMDSDKKLPMNLVKILEREQSKEYDPAPEDSGKWGKEVSFFTLPQGTFKLNLIRLEDPNLDGSSLWLLRIYPAADPFTKSNRLIEKAGLTWREMEICCLIHDGLGRNEIAERLFISAHTVKTHLKKIHKKLGVNSRTQLVAYLNQHAGEATENHFS
ncbi:MAG: hypothetical protein GWM98_01965 [Nitrospinaceae bacterium]|nr:helix-turn-helix transcriptional regulator [Nitrospinaceae bacterium]NIR53499.1 helix-turn-helix transcriptional regulator [Nitrospinaceae bacterium]NIS83898.1 helix-turn-helix transcriptional regulator [Nitrospinaceae bacterium]NIT80700.1 helix-turn-helix transcriptional regulator [Nitrospinaceae bacterium]NIU43015.1 helix-turn-helix transcriptional regulator [Nitrospinaceae bacterium]